MFAREGQGSPFNGFASGVSTFSDSASTMD